MSETNGSSGNTKGTAKLRSRAWFLTWNNPSLTQSDFRELLESRGFEKGVFQLETGENGTKHYQGVIYSTEARTLSTMKEICPLIHWEPCKNWIQATKYCTKVDREEDPEIWGLQIKIQNKIQVIKKEQLHPWQRIILDIYEKQNDRQILWAWDDSGNVGKTTLAKYIWKNNKATLYVTGGAHNIKCAIVKFYENTGLYPENVIFYYTRTQEDRISYQAMEEIKDGIFFSGKYESGMFVMPTPKIMVLANFPPDTSALSQDRWVLQNIGTMIQIENPRMSDIVKIMKPNE